MFKSVINSLGSIIEIKWLKKPFYDCNTKIPKYQHFIINNTIEVEANEIYIFLTMETKLFQLKFYKDQR